MPAKDISEPGFRHDSGGDWETVHPGNREFIKGDKIPRPEGGGGGGGSEAGSGPAVDDFIFTLSREEFLNIFFDDLELPNLMRTAGRGRKTSSRARRLRQGRRALQSVRCATLKTALGRRIALGAPARKRSRPCAKSWTARLEGKPQFDHRIAQRARIELEARLKRVPFLDEIDLRYRNRVACRSRSRAR